jgi:hypothetical protein
VDQAYAHEARRAIPVNVKCSAAVRCDVLSVKLYQARLSVPRRAESLIKIVEPVEVTMQQGVNFCLMDHQQLVKRSPDILHNRSLPGHTPPRKVAPIHP